MRPNADALRFLGAIATIVVGAVHLQQYADFIADVPTIGVLFLLNGLAAGLAAILLATRHATLGALSAIALSVGALLSLAISMTDAGLFAYTEPAFRAAIVIAIAAEVTAIILLLAYLATQRRSAPKRLDWTERQSSSPADLRAAGSGPPPRI